MQCSYCGLILDNPCRNARDTENCTNYDSSPRKDDVHADSHYEDDDDR